MTDLDKALANEMMHRFQGSFGQKWINDEDFLELHQGAVEQSKEFFAAKGGLAMAFYIHGKHKDFSKNDPALMPVLLADWPPPATIQGKPIELPYDPKKTTDPTQENVNFNALDFFAGYLNMSYGEAS